MDRFLDGRGSVCHRGCNSGVVGPVISGKSTFDFGGIGPAVFGDNRAVVELHDKGRVVFAPVGIDHEA